MIEAIADSTYFRVYEANVKLKNSVGVKLLRTETKQNECDEPRITLESMESEEIEEIEEIEEEVTQDVVDEPVKNPYVPKKRSLKKKVKRPTLQEYLTAK